LRSSLIDEIDRSNDARANDILIQTVDEEVVPFVAAGLDPTTAAAIVDIDGNVLSSTGELDGTRLVDLYTLHDGPFDVSFRNLDTVVGADNMRGVAVPVGDSEDFVETFVFVASSIAGVDRTIRDARQAVTVALPLLVLLVGFLVWLMAGRALRPVERIRSEVEDISGHDLNRRVPEPKTGDEIDALAVTMNAMLTRLEEASERQRRFAADASHELRSPLASIAAQLDVDLAHPNTAAWPDTARSLRAETTRMQNLVDDLLLLARSQSGQPPSMVSVAIDDVITEVLAIVPSRDGITIDASEIARIDLQADASQIARLVTNLVTNAIRHAESDVVVALRTTDGIAILSVDDDGPGIAPAERERVFERFFRIDDARTRHIGGSGLGLALCRETCQVHNGSIAAEDSSLGGARIVATFPL
jgi:signal transduction histidine kinase